MISTYEEALSTKIHITDLVSIYQPLLANRWTLDIPMLGENSLLKLQATKCEFSLVRKQLTCFVEQSILGHEYDEITRLAEQNTFTVKVHGVDGMLKPVHSVELLFSKLIDHFIIYDYSKNAVLLHKLIFEFKQTNITKSAKSD